MQKEAAKTLGLRCVKALNPSVTFRNPSGLFEIEGDGRVDTLSYTLYFPEMYLIEILRWPFVVIETSEKAHSTEKLKRLLPSLIVEIVWRATRPPSTPAISPNAFHQNFEIAIFVECN